MDQPHAVVEMYRAAKTDGWLAFLESRQLLSAVGPPDDRYRVVAPVTSLWGDASPSGGSRSSVVQLRLLRDAVGSRPLPPADFVVSLRQERERDRTSRVKIAPFSLPAALSSIGQQVEQSRSMLSLEDNWDGEGSVGYNEETWQRAARVVVDSALRSWKTHRRVPPTPVISNGPDGSIDIVWRSSHRKLLLNVPEDPQDVATFYGRDLERGHSVVQGETDPLQNNEWLLGWLTS